MAEHTLRELEFAIEEDIIDIYRHWHPGSQKYAGGDALATALYLGWTLKNVVLAERHLQRGSRRVMVFHFELVKGDESRSMAVVGNPYIDRVIADYGLHVLVLRPQKANLRAKSIRKSASPSGNEAWA